MLQIAATLKLGLMLTEVFQFNFDPPFLEYVLCPHDTITLFLYSSKENLVESNWIKII